MRTAILLVLGAAFLAAQQPAPAADPAKGVNFYSIEKEMALGKMLADDVLRQAQPVEDAAITAYVDGIAQKVWANVGAPMPITVRVVEDASFNSMVLPGGQVFVNTGLLEMVETEAELAAVLAHQLGHVAARHGTKQDTRGQMVNLASVPLIFQGGWTGYGIRQAAPLAIPMGFLTFARGFEFEADELGIQYLDQAGYDPNAFLILFERIQAMEQVKKGTISQLFSTHPPTEDRIARTQEDIDALAPRADRITSTPEFEQMQQRLAQRPAPPTKPVAVPPGLSRQQFI